MGNKVVNKQLRGGKWSGHLMVSWIEPGNINEKVAARWHVMEFSTSRSPSWCLNLLCWGAIDLFLIRSTPTPSGCVIIRSLLGHYWAPVEAASIRIDLVDCSAGSWSTYRIQSDLIPSGSIRIGWIWFQLTC